MQTQVKEKRVKEVTLTFTEEEFEQFKLVISYISAADMQTAIDANKRQEFDREIWFGIAKSIFDEIK